MRKFLKRIAKFVAPNLLDEDLFNADITVNRARELFARYVTHVELENHNFCNRTCWFCPNCQIDRKGDITLMDQAVFEKIISCLAAIDYREGVFWARYHEPLAEHSIFERVAYARKRLPHAILVAYSNGDYLKPEILEKLAKAGLNRLHISLYMRYENESQAHIDDGIRTFEKRTGLKVSRELTSHGFFVSGADMDVSLSIPLFGRSDRENITSSRGGAIELECIENLNRRAVCFNPVHSVNIDYNGKVILCCQLRSYDLAHITCVVGDLNQKGYGIFESYRDLGKFRNHLLRTGIKAGPCRKCNINEDPINYVGRSDVLARTIAVIPGLMPLVSKAGEYIKTSRRYNY